MSDEAVIAQKEPYVMTLEPGEYWFCACGRSKSQPFCDGSHTQTSITPIQFTIEKSRKVALCGCKQSSNRPFCDGTHINL